MFVLFYLRIKHGPFGYSVWKLQSLTVDPDTETVMQKAHANPLAGSWQGSPCSLGRKSDVLRPTVWNVETGVGASELLQ